MRENQQRHGFSEYASYKKVVKPLEVRLWMERERGGEGNHAKLASVTKVMNAQVKTSH